jgi:serine/threonine-protein kinase
VRQDDQDIWVWDLNRKSFTRVTKDRAVDRMPVWTVDSQQIIFSSTRDGSSSVYRQRADGTGVATRLTEAQINQFPISMAPKGDRVLLQVGLGGANGSDLFLLDLDRPTERVSAQSPKPRDAKPSSFLVPEPLVKTPDGEANAMISPNGRWLAYQSNESGNWDIYVRSFPVVDNGMRSTVSTNGGTQPRWSSDGGELFYLSPRNEMMSVRVGSGTAWSAGAPEKLFDASGYFNGGGTAPFYNYDIGKDGRFLMIKPIASAASDANANANLVVVQNWTDELKRLVPAR